MNAHEVLLLTPEEAGRETNLALSGARFRQIVDNAELRAPRMVGGWRRISTVDGALPNRQASSQARQAHCRRTRIRNPPGSKAETRVSFANDCRKSAAPARTQKSCWVAG